ncbi:MAG: hypothetical protein WCF17_18290 [Terracidiphilus sp.]
MPAELSFHWFAWRNLWRRRRRTSPTLAGIAMGIGAFVGRVEMEAAGAVPASRGARLSPVEALRHD